MASDMNKVMMIGRLTNDPELKHTPNGASVAGFSIANNRSFSVNGEKKEEVTYVRCIAWNKGGELIAQYCKKGHRIGIEGRLQVRNWQDKDGNKKTITEIIVENFQFLQAKENGQQPSADLMSSIGHEVPAGQVPPATEQSPFSDMDIPF